MSTAEVALLRRSVVRLRSPMLCNWDPAVAHALADWLESHATDLERPGSRSSCDSPGDLGHALAVAGAFMKDLDDWAAAQLEPKPQPAERPAPVGSWWRQSDGAIVQVDGDYLDGSGDQIVTYTLYRQFADVAHGKWGGKELAAAYTRIEAHEVPDWVEVAW